MKVCCKCPYQSRIVELYTKLFNIKCEQCDTCDKHCVPTIVDGEHSVRHIPAIIKYIGLKAQCPCYFNRDIIQQSSVDSAIESTNILYQLFGKFISFIKCPDTAQFFQAAYVKHLHEEVLALLQCSNKCIEAKTYLVGERISLADFYRAAVNVCIFSVLTEKEASKYGNLIRHINTIAANYPVFTDVIGPIKYADATLQIKPNKVEKAEKAPKADKPAAKQEKEEEAADEPKPVEKKVNKYEYKFDLNAWKRHYKNLNWVTQDWQEYFYQNFDSNEMSLWFIDYKEPKSFEVPWKTKNLAIILLQRLRGEKAENNTFGNFIVTKTETGLNLIGIFLMPGKEVIPEIAETSGTQSFNFTRLDDFKQPEVKQFIKNVWDWSEEKEIVYHGKNFGKCTGDGETFV